MSSKKGTLFEIIVGICTIVGCIAAVLVIPEFRKITGLDSPTPSATNSPSIQTILAPTSKTISSVTNSHQPVAQSVQWIPNSNETGGGLCVGWDHTATCPSDKIFIPWNILKVELEQNVLPQVPNVPTGSSLVLQASSDGTPNTIIKVVDSSGAEKAYIWIGENPENSWLYDGLIRVGDPKTLKIWETFVRYSNGTYLKK